MSNHPVEDPNQEVSTTELNEVQTNAVSSDYKVRGKKPAPGGTGVLGHNTATSGTAYGVEGITDSADDSAAGVRGVGTATTGGIYGVLGFVESPSAVGVVGAAADTTPMISLTGAATGVWGHTDKSSADDNVSFGTGVAGEASASTGETYGVMGLTNSPDGYAIYGDGDSKTTGDQEVSGDLDVGGTRSVANVGFNYELTSDQVIGSGWTRVHFDNKRIDPLDEYDTTNHEFRPAYDGVYRVEFRVKYKNTLPGGTTHSLKISNNDSGFRVMSAKETPPNGGSFKPHHTLTRSIFGVNAGDTITFEVSQGSGNDKTIQGAYDLSNLAVTKVG